MNTNLFFSDSSSICVQIVSQIDRVNGRASSFVQGRLFADPEVDFPVQWSGRVHEGVEDDVAVAFVKLAVTMFLHLKC